MPKGNSSDSSKCIAHVELEGVVQRTLTWMELISEKLILDLTIEETSEQGNATAVGIREIQMEISKQLFDCWKGVHEEWRARL